MTAHPTPEAVREALEALENFITPDKTNDFNHVCRVIDRLRAWLATTAVSPLDTMRETVIAAGAQPAVTHAPGWKLVPSEPTLSMIMAYDAQQDALGIPAYANVRLIWPAMLAAGPELTTPPSQAPTAAEAQSGVTEEEAKVRIATHFRLSSDNLTLEGSKNCADEVFEIAREALAARPAGSNTCGSEAPGHTDLMASPEAIDKWLEVHEAAFRAGAEAMREACAKIPGQWIDIFGLVEIKHTSAQKYAIDAMLDLAEAIRALALPVADADAPSTKGGPEAGR